MYVTKIKHKYENKIHFYFHILYYICHEVGKTIAVPEMFRLEQFPGVYTSYDTSNNTLRYIGAPFFS